MKTLNVAQFVSFLAVVGRVRVLRCVWASFARWRGEPEVSPPIEYDLLHPGNRASLFVEYHGGAAGAADLYNGVAHGVEPASCIDAE